VTFAITYVMARPQVLFIFVFVAIVLAALVTRCSTTNFSNW
jgi:hypothetical protein